MPLTFLRAKYWVQDDANWHKEVIHQIFLGTLEIEKNELNFSGQRYRSMYALLRHLISVKSATALKFMSAKRVAKVRLVSVADLVS